MALCTSILPPGTSAYPLVLILLYFAALAVSWMHHVAYLRFHAATYGEELLAAHLAFCIIGSLAYLLAGSTLWLRAARYATKASDRIRDVVCGACIVFLLKDFPLFVIEFLLLTRHGWQSDYQGSCFIVQFCFFLLMFVTIWLSFLWCVTSLIERRWGGDSALPGVQLSTGVAQQAPPAMMLQEKLCNRHTGPVFPPQVGAAPQGSGFQDFGHGRKVGDQRRVRDVHI